MVVWRICRDGDLVAGVLEDGAGGVSGICAFKGDLEADFEEVLFERDDMVVVCCACDFRAIVARLCEEAGDFDDRSHGDDAGVKGEGARWLLGGASVGDAVGDRAVLSVVDSVFQRLGSEWRRDLGRPHRSGNQSVGASDANGVGKSVGFGLGRSETRKRTASAPRSVGVLDVNGVGTLVGFFSLETLLVERHRKRRQDFGWLESRTRTASGCRRQCGSIGVGNVGQLASGPRSVGAADVNSVGMSATAWVDRRQGVGWAGEPWSSTPSGRRLGLVWR